MRPSLREVLVFWLQFGCTSFGGPAAQISFMQRELVEKRRWISHERFQHAWNFCMLLPGPEAQQLATYIGWSMHGVRGGLLAGILFVLPSALLLWALAWLTMAGASSGVVAGAFEGIQPAVVALLAGAVWRMARRNLTGPGAGALALAAFGALLFFNVPFPAVIAAAALVGVISGRRGTPETVNTQTAPRSIPWVRVLLVGAILWIVPLGLAALAKETPVLFDLGVFFSKVAVVTFGGAYAILPYVAQEAVSAWHWLTPAQMMTGLGLAESTPGPLIMVLQYVGFVAAWQHPGALNPLAAATLGALLTTWVTFLPGFVWIFLFAPSLDRIQSIRPLRQALWGVTAAVTGLMLHLTLQFGAAVLWISDGCIRWPMLALALGFFVVFEKGWGPVPLGMIVAAGIGVVGFYGGL